MTQYVDVLTCQPVSESVHIAISVDTTTFIKITGLYIANNIKLQYLRNYVFEGGGGGI